jgi:hypothetical protein
MASRQWRIRLRSEGAEVPLARAFVRGLLWAAKKVGFRPHESRSREDSRQGQSSHRPEQQPHCKGEHPILEQDTAVPLPTRPTFFENEKALVDTFVINLSGSESPWGEVQIGLEFNYQRGRTDIVACTADAFVLAFEAKLADWRTALQQAYRNRCFAHRSYVLLPREVAIRAHQYSAEFDKRQVGICYLEGSEVVLLLDCNESEPLQPWLLEQARLHVLSRESPR